jgi:hypothetical protein
MDGHFSIIDTSPTALKIRLGAHDLDGESPQLYRFLKPVLDTAQHSEVRLQAQDAEVVTLEGIAVLERLRNIADAVGVRLILEVPHAALARKLEVTGAQSLLHYRG